MNQANTLAANGRNDLTKSGPGTLRLGLVNPLTGVTRPLEGTLQISGSGLQFSRLDMSAAGAGAVVFLGNSVLGDLSGTRDLGAGVHSLTIGNADSLAVTPFSGALSAASLTKVGLSTLTLSGSNTLPTATVSAGALGFGRRVSAAGATTVASGATIGIGVAENNADYYTAADVDALFAGTFAGVNNTAGVSNVGIDTSAGDFTYASNIAGPRGLAKFGPNTLTLSGNSTFTGGLQVAGGRVVPLSAAAIGSGAVTITSGTFDLNGLTIGNTVSVSGGILAGGTIAASQVLGPTSGAGRISAVLAGTGGLVKTGSGTLVLAAANTYAGGTRIEAGTLSVEPGSSLGVTSNVTLAAAGQSGQSPGVQFDNVGATSATSRSLSQLTLEGGAGNVSLVRSADQNLALAIDALTRPAGTSINFGSSGGADPAANGISIAGQAAGFMSATAFYNSENFAWYDAGGFVRGINYGSDPGTAQINASTWTGVGTAHTRLSGAATQYLVTPSVSTLAIAPGVTGVSLGGAGVGTVSGILKQGDGVANFGRASSSVQPPLDGALSIRVADRWGTLGITAADTFFANGRNDLIKTGPGLLRLTFSSTSPLTGVTRPLEGTLQISGSGIALSTLEMSYSDRVIFEGNSTLGGLSGADSLGLGGFVVSVGNNNADTTYSGVLSSGTLRKIGTGTLALSGSSTISSVTSIDNGTLAIDWLSPAGQPSPLGTASSINLGSAGTTGALRYTGPAHTSDRVINLSGTTGGATLDASGAGALVLSNALTAAAGIKNLTLTGTSTAMNSIGVIPSPVANVAKTGSGLWRLTGNSGYTGQLSVLDGTIVVAANVNASGNSPFGSQNGEIFLPIIGSSAAGVTGTAGLLIEGSREISRGMSIAALGAGSSQVAVLGIRGDGGAIFGGGHDITLGRGVTLQASNSGTVTFANNWVGDPVAFTIGSEGNAGVVILESQLPTSTGVSIVRGTARLQEFSDDRILPATPVTIGSSLGAATLDLNGLSQSLSRLTFAANSGSVTTGTAAGGTLRLVNSGSVSVSGTGHVISSLVDLVVPTTFDTGSASVLTVSNVVSSTGGAMGLTKTGLGTLTLSTANTYSGATIISQGTLALGAAGSFANSSIVTVGDAGSSAAVLDLTSKVGGFSFGAGQTLKGGGTLKQLSSGTLTVAGLFSPGNSPGLFTYDGGTTLLSGTTLMEIFGTSRATSPSHGSGFYDAVDVVNGGILNFSGGQLELTFSQLFPTDTSFSLFSPFDTASLTGNFAGVSVTGAFYSGLTWTSSGNVWKSTQTTGGQSLEFNATTGALVIVVPEPAAIVLAGIGIAAAAWAIRRRRR